MKLSEIKIIFLGTSFFAKEILRLLLKNKANISCVVTQPDRPVGRKKTLRPPEVKVFSLENNLTIKQFEKIDKEALSFFEKEQPDLLIVAAYGIILPKELLTLPKLGCLNFHASFLPALRGPSPIQTSLLLGQEKTGVTLMGMDYQVDHGRIVDQAEVAIDPQDDYFSLESKLANVSENLIPAIEKLLNGEITPTQQNHQQATFTRIIKKEDGKINWHSSTQKIYNQYRAYKKWPGVFSRWNDKKISLLEIEIGPENQSASPGEIKKLEDRLIVGTGNGTVIIKKLQLEGKKPLEANQFLNGHPDFIEGKLR